MTRTTFADPDDDGDPFVRFDLGGLMREREENPGLDLPDTEAQLLTRVVKLARRLRLRYHHDYWSGSSEQRGFPDVFLAGPGGIAIWELKSITGTLSPEQQEWGDDLKAAGADYSVITPADWASGEVQRRLRRLAEEDWD